MNEALTRKKWRFRVLVILLVVVGSATAILFSTKYMNKNSGFQADINNNKESSSKASNNNNKAVTAAADQSTASPRTKPTKRFETAEDLLLEFLSPIGGGGSDADRQQQQQQHQPKPTRHINSTPNITRTRRTISMPPLPDANLCLFTMRAIVSAARISLAINTSDPFFNSSSTCNTVNGGQLFPPPVCTKQHPCTDLSILYASLQTVKISQPQFGTEDQLACSGWSCSTEIRHASGSKHDTRTVNDTSTPKIEKSTLPPSYHYTRRGCTVRENLQFIRYMTLPYVAAMNNGAGPTVEQIQSVLPLRRWYDDGPAQKIDVPDTFLPETKTRHVCKHFPPMPETPITTAPKNNISAAESKIPLIVFIPGTGQNATALYTYPVRDTAQRRGFAVISIQAMNRHWHASGWLGPSESGTKNDFLFRNITHNDDIKFVDAVIDDAVASGKIDPKRIYIFGISNGLTFGALYGIMRSGSTDGGALLYRRSANGTREIDPELQRRYTGRTPGGNRVAAVGGASGLDPFKGVGWAERCHTWPVPRSRVPFYMVSAICDVVRCTWARDWVNRMANEVGSSDVRWRLLDHEGRVQRADYCSDERVKKTCSTGENLMGHSFMPDYATTLAVDFFSLKKLDD